MDMKPIDLFKKRINRGLYMSNDYYLVKAEKIAKDMAQGKIIVVPDTQFDTEVYEHDLVFFPVTKAIDLGRDHYLVKDGDIYGYHLNGGKLNDIVDMDDDPNNCMRCGSVEQVFDQPDGSKLCEYCLDLER